MRKPPVPREALRWIIPIIVVMAMSVTFVQAQSELPWTASTISTSTPSTTVLSAGSNSTPTVPEQSTTTRNAATSLTDARISNTLPFSDRTVLHTKTHMVAESPTSMPNQGSYLESWFDAATGQGRYEDLVHNPDIHRITIYDKKSILCLDLLTKSYDKAPLPGGISPGVVYSEHTYGDNLAAGKYELLGKEEVGGKPTLKVKIMPTKINLGQGSTPGEPPTSHLVVWPDASSFLPVQSFTCKVDSQTGELVKGLGTVVDVAEWIPRAELPADFFDQAVTDDFQSGSVPKG